MRVTLLLCLLLSFHFVPGKYHCPVLYSVFTNNSHIVANKVTGNVFSNEVGELALCIDPHTKGVNSAHMVQPYVKPN